ncbi:7-cyano-7-deazaguanine synthase QueC [Desulfovermiculus halophilus]|uniref:7-cyano-7-deazaguanine synthase QueC n=1 Tax=Desulfovermiculus halophilus TaxID=339722 RepID=UPI000550DC87|nr:7-cyano-7-deazaguanine synthase QueC [Desulfovermiculus halophilus]
MKKAVVLFSGGLDSTTCLAIAREEGFEPCALSFSYSQRHEIELAAASRVAQVMDIARHLVVDVPLGRIGGSALTEDTQVPKGRSLEQSTHIPSTYVPARNTIFLSLALGWAEVLGAADIFIGVNAVDYSGYPDCRPEFIAAFEHLANLGTKESIEGRMQYRIRAPLVHWSKAQIIRKGLELGVDYSLTHSCYDPDQNGLACGACDSCRLRRKGFLEAGLDDPAGYAVRDRDI